MINGSMSRRLSSRHERRVAPEPGSCDNMVEIRPKRVIRVKHVNPKKRDDKFEKEMNAYLQYRENAVLGVTNFHTGLPRQKSNLQTVHQNTSQSNSTNGKQLSPHAIQGSSLNRPTGTGSFKENTYTEDMFEIEEGWAESLGDSNGLTSKLTSRGKITKMSPSRSSVNSTSIQSVSSVQVDVNTRPSSLVMPMAGLNERKEDEYLTQCSTIIPENQNDCPKASSSFSPAKTKDHRPVSGKSIKRGARSIAFSEASETLKSLHDLEVDTHSHTGSINKDMTLFFIHGVGGSADIWNSQIDFFANLGIEVVAPDLLGHGLSECPDVASMYHFNEILADIEAVFDKYCKRQNAIIGHSYGCAFAAALGRRRQRRVTKLVLISGGGPIPLAPQPGIFSLPICCLTCIKPCLFSKFERNAFHNTESSGLSREQAFDLPLYVLSHMMHGQSWLDGDQLYHSWLTSPTLLLHGKYDNFVTLEEEQDMERTIHLSYLVVIDNASHMVMMEAPNEVNKSLYEFFFQELVDPLHDYDGRKSRISSAKSTRGKHSKSLA